MLDMILVGIMLLTTLAVVGLFYYTEKVYVKPPVDENKEKEAFFKDHQDTKTIPTLFKVEKLLIGLSSEEKKPNSRMHYLELEVHLVLFKDEQVGIAKAYLPMIQDRIITIASKMHFDDLLNLTGRILLEDRLIRSINQEMKKSTNETLVKQIYFTRFSVQ